MRSIGQLARESGLTVSALRFYDGAGVFGPAWVDPQSGYRWYAPEQLADARLICRLRRVGLPLADIRLVLQEPANPATAHRVLDEHLRRLEEGLADARLELSSVRAAIDQRMHPMTVTTAAGLPSRTELTLDRAELAAALAAVRFAVSVDPELPMLAGVLFDLDGDVLRLVTTDRYRIAVAQAAVRGHRGSVLNVLLPTALADDIARLARTADADELTLVVDAGRVSASADGDLAEGWSLDLDFPDYRRLLRLEPLHRISVEGADLRSAVAAGESRSEVREQDGVPFDVVVLALDPDGSVRIAANAEAAEGGPEGSRIGVNREFLLEALEMGTDGQLILELGGPIHPLAIRPAGVEGTFSLLMPIRLHQD